MSRRVAGTDATQREGAVSWTHNAGVMLSTVWLHRSGDIALHWLGVQFLNTRVRTLLTHTAGTFFHTTVGNFAFACLSSVAVSRWCAKTYASSGRPLFCLSGLAEFVM